MRYTVTGETENCKGQVAPVELTAQMSHQPSEACAPDAKLPPIRQRRITNHTLETVAVHLPSPSDTNNKRILANDVLQRPGTSDPQNLQRHNISAEYQPEHSADALQALMSCIFLQ